MKSFSRFIFLAVSLSLNGGLVHAAIDNTSELFYVPLDSPCRIVDTGGSNSPFNTTHTQQSFKAWGEANQLDFQRDADGTDALGDCLPVAGSQPSAIAANITVAAKASKAKGNVIAYPLGTDAPAASLVNFQANNIANSSIITIDPDGDQHFTVQATINGFDLGGSEQVHVIVDILGYFYSRAALAATDNKGLSYIPLTQPCRIVNTVKSNQLFQDPDHKNQGFLAWGAASDLDDQRDTNSDESLGDCLPESNMNPVAMMGNVTAVAKSFKSTGNIVAFQGGGTAPTASLVNFSDNNIANASIISLNPNASPHLNIEASINTNAPDGSKQVDVIIDTQGYFYSEDALTAADKTGLSYIPLSQPCRIVDTRGINKAFDDQTRETQGFKAWGGQADLDAQRDQDHSENLPACEPKAGKLPTAIMANVTVAAKRYQSTGNVVAYPAGSATPKSSLVNFSGNNIANSSILALGSNGFNITADILDAAEGGSKQADVIVDVMGYFYPTDKPDTHEGCPAPLLSQNVINYPIGGNTQFPAMQRDEVLVIELTPPADHTGKISWGPAVSTNQTTSKIGVISTCPGVVNSNVADETVFPCRRSSNQDSLWYSTEATPGFDKCQLQANKTYYVNIFSGHDVNVVNDSYDSINDCEAGKRCAIALNIK